MVIFFLVWPRSSLPALVGGPESGSRWSARSAARTNDLYAGEDPPHADGRVDEAKDVATQVIRLLL